MDIRRLYQHACTTSLRVRSLIPKESAERLGRLITESERKHRAELRLIVEGALDWRAILRGETSRDRATDLFSEYRIWDTEENSGVLLYLLVADHKIEIVADRGIARSIPQHTWDEICERMAIDLKNGNFEAGLSAGIQRIEELLIEHYPSPEEGTINELPDAVIIL